MHKRYVMKVLVGGDGGVGKTSLLCRYVDGQFSQNMQMTVGVEFFVKEVQYNSSLYVLQIWDLGGQDRFRFMFDGYVNGARGALLLIDLTNYQTLHNLYKWVEILRNNDKDLPILLVGSKSDMHSQIAIDDEIARKMVDTYRMNGYVKTSAKNGDNIECAFETLTGIVTDKTH